MKDGAGGPCRITVESEALQIGSACRGDHAGIVEVGRIAKVPEAAEEQDGGQETTSGGRRHRCGRIAMRNDVCRPENVVVTAAHRADVSRGRRTETAGELCTRRRRRLAVGVALRVCIAKFVVVKLASF